jgi:hypothetical protein
MEITDEDLKELLEAARGMFCGYATNQPGRWCEFSAACNRLEQAVEKVETSLEK